MRYRTGIRTIEIGEGRKAFETIFGELHLFDPTNPDAKRRAYYGASALAQQVPDYLTEEGGKEDSRFVCKCGRVWPYADDATKRRVVLDSIIYTHASECPALNNDEVTK